MAQSRTCLRVIAHNLLVSISLMTLISRKHIQGAIGANIIERMSVRNIAYVMHKVTVT